MFALFDDQPPTETNMPRTLGSQCAQDQYKMHTKIVVEHFPFIAY